MWPGRAAGNAWERMQRDGGKPPSCAATEPASILDATPQLLSEENPGLTLETCVSQGRMREAEQRYPGNFRGWVGFSVPVSHQITAGADILLMPSRFEPCGLNQARASLTLTEPKAFILALLVAPLGATSLSPPAESSRGRVCYQCPSHTPTPAALRHEVRDSPGRPCCRRPS